MEDQQDSWTKRRLRGVRIPPASLGVGSGRDPAVLNVEDEQGRRVGAVDVQGQQVASVRWDPRVIDEDAFWALLGRSYGIKRDAVVET